MTNQIDYFEIGTSDAPASREFYGGMFGWQISPAGGPAQYSAINESQGGLWDRSGFDGENWAIFYVHVDDVSAAVAKAEALGATVAIPVVDNGNIEFAHLVDPMGNRFGVWRPKEA